MLRGSARIATSPPNVPASSPFAGKSQDWSKVRAGTSAGISRGSAVVVDWEPASGAGDRRREPGAGVWRGNSRVVMAAPVTTAPPPAACTPALSACCPATAGGLRLPLGARDGGARCARAAPGPHPRPAARLRRALTLAETDGLVR